MQKKIVPKLLASKKKKYWIHKIIHVQSWRASMERWLSLERMLW